MKVRRNRYDVYITWLYVHEEVVWRTIFFSLIHLPGEVDWNSHPLSPVNAQLFPFFLYSKAHVSRDRITNTLLSNDADTFEFFMVCLLCLTMCLQLSSDSYFHSNRYSIHFVFTLFLSFRNIIFNKSFSYDLVACPSKCKNRNDLDRQVKSSSQNTSRHAALSGYSCTFIHIDLRQSG